MATDRLRFGIWREEDIELARAIWGDPMVTRFTGGPFSEEAIIERLANEIASWRIAGMQYWPIFLAGSQIVGCCGLRAREEHGRAELGFHLRPCAWGRGLATEAARAVIDWAPNNGVDSLVAGHHPLNRSSKRTLVELGFTYVGEEFYAPTEQLEPFYTLQLGSPGRAAR